MITNELFNIALSIWPFPDVLPEKGLSLDSYNILDETDDIDFTNTKPIKYIFDETIEEHVTSWSSLYQSMMKYLYNMNKDLFVSIMSKENYCGATKTMLSKDENTLRHSGLIADGYYIEMNNNTARKIKILKTLLIDMEIEDCSLIVSIVPA